MEEIINSVMQSPENTNPNVLRSQLQNMGGGSDGGVTDVEAEYAQDSMALLVNMPIRELYELLKNGARIRVSLLYPGTTLLIDQFYYLSKYISGGDLDGEVIPESILVFTREPSGNPTLEGTEVDGVVRFVQK